MALQWSFCGVDQKVLDTNAVTSGETTKKDDKLSMVIVGSNFLVVALLVVMWTAPIPSLLQDSLWNLSFRRY